MRKFVKSFRHLIALALICLLAFAVFEINRSLGVCLESAMASAVTIIAFWQLSQFALSQRRGECFISGLTPEQVKEFGDILNALKADAGSMKDVIKEFPQLRGHVDTLRRAGIGGGNGALRPGSVVTDGCAEYLAAIAVLGAEKGNKLADCPQREALLQRSAKTLNLIQRTAVTTSDIPMPVGYANEVVALVSQYGSARRYGTVLPLGTGVVKLPKLTTDPAFGLLSASGTVTEKVPQLAWVTFTAEKFGGLVRLPAEIVEDSFIGIGNFVATYAARNLALVEDQVFFLNLDGSTYGAVKGLCGSTITNSKVTQMASTKTHYSDATLANLRTLRGVPDAAALATSAYYMHPSFEQLLSSFNTAGDRPYNPQAQIAGTGANPFLTAPTLDGFPVRWVPIMPAYSTSANVSKVFMLFGDLSYQYLGIMGQIRFDTSMEAGFATDEVLIRALERFTIGLMANGAVGGLQTAAS